MDLNDAAVFVKVVQTGSFSAAARQLQMPVSTVSHRVARLEKQLGLTLLQRTTRQLTLTEAGDIYFQHAEAGLTRLHEAQLAVTESAREVHGLLRITAPADIGEQLLYGILCSLHQQWPGISVELILVDRYVDLVAEGVDVAIRTGSLRDSTLVARYVGEAQWMPFASPDYLAQAGPLDSPADLRHHRCLQFTSQGRDAWSLSRGKEFMRVPMAGQMIANNIAVISAMATAGQGVALLPAFLCRDLCNSGRLRRVLPGWSGRSDPIHVVYPRQRFMPPKLRAFVDIAVSQLPPWFADAEEKI